MQRILIVDDSLVTIKFLMNVLSEERYNIDTASNGFEAIKKLESSRYDLVLLDLFMPGLDGIEVLEHVKKLNLSTDFVITSDGRRLDDINECYRLGVIDYINKPYSKKDTPLKIRLALKSVQLRKAEKEIERLSRLLSNREGKTSAGITIHQQTGNIQIGDHSKIINRATSKRIEELDYHIANSELPNALKNAAIEDLETIRGIANKNERDQTTLKVIESKLSSIKSFIGTSSELYQKCKPIFEFLQCNFF